MMINISLTGGNGFVGKNLISYLKERALHTNLISREQLGDANIELYKDCDVLVHLAGKAHDLKKSANSEEYFKVNFELTKNIYDSFLRSKAKKFIFISSVKASADSVEGILYEDNNPNPQTDYGKSKLLAEEYIKRQELPVGKSYYILRPCMIHGPGNKGNLNLLYTFVKKGIPYPLAAFQNKRSFLSIENLCFVIKELIVRDDIPSDVYHVADDEPLSTNEVVTILADSLNFKPRLWPISKKVISFFAKVGDRLTLPLNTERLHKLTESYIISNTKLKKHLGKELPLNSREGLRITAQHFKH
ncbi:NAD-dependent epimerase/dehydratase family protein [Pedobacter immunditicola]|uniref:NAD-dependent epimerase/dehydratase family protein n=1 Tax=Pedobacter immunditicola TaxID=3133440 RepID=UPI0030AE68A1